MASADGRPGCVVDVTGGAAPLAGVALRTLLPTMAVAGASLLLGVWLARRLARAVTEPPAALAEGVRGCPGLQPPVHGLRPLRDALAGAGANARERAGLQQLQLHAEEPEAALPSGPVPMSPRQHGQARLAEANDPLQRAQPARPGAGQQEGRHGAEEALRARDALLTMLDHDLRNPLNALSAAAEVLKLLGSPDPLAREAGDVVQRQLQQLTWMTEALADLAQATAGQLKLRMAPLDAVALANAVAAESMRGSTDAEGGLQVLATGCAWMSGDRARLERLASQLLRGAMRSAPPGATVRLQIGLQRLEHGTGVLVEIRRLGGGPAAPDPGWGSGPTLALEWGVRLVQLHGGTLQWHSGRDGRSVQLRFPAIAAPVSPPPAPVPPGAARTLLLVEDDADAAAALCAALEVDGHRVTLAAAGAGGLQRLLDVRPEVAIIDVGLPGHTGFALARSARAAGYAGLMIALSAGDRPEGGHAALKAGFDACLVKPLDLARLRQLMTAA